MQRPKKKKKRVISFSLTPTNNEASLQINTEDIHINIVCLNTMRSNVKCKITNENPLFCQHAPDVTKWIYNRPIRFISRQHAVHIPSHIKCHLKPLISHSQNDSSRPVNCTGVWYILCPKIYTFANKLLGVEREKEEFCVRFYSHSISSTLHQLPMICSLTSRWPLAWSRVCVLVKYGLNVKLRMSLEPSREIQTAN